MKDVGIGVILADIPKWERNLKPTKDRCVVLCPSYGIDDCSKTFFVSKKWWEKCPLDSDGKYDLLRNHWGHHSKSIHEEGRIAINTLKMADNHLRILHHHYLHRHGDKIFLILTLRT